MDAAGGAISMLTRRGFSGAAVATAAGLVPRASLAANPDVIVIGAGMAGIAAAQIIQQSRHSVVVLEARERIGGRTHTESGTFGFPHDHSAAWFEAAERNPLVKQARGLDFELARDPETVSVYVGGREA